MENDQEPPETNPCTNHATTIVDSVDKENETTSTTVPVSIVLPSSAAEVVSTGKMPPIAGLGASADSATKNEETDQTIIPPTKGESSLSPPPSASQPLSAFTSTSKQDFLPPASQCQSKPHALSRTMGAGAGSTSNRAGLKPIHVSPTNPNAPTSSKLQVASSLSKTSTPTSSTAPSPVVTDEQNILDEKLNQLRRPLTDNYGSYISATDTSLHDARLRLHTAMEQTRRLRQAFTDRVYKKYRVCLEPIPTTQENLTRVLSSPQECVVMLEQQIHQLSEEKTAEKREAASLNTEMTQAPEREKVERIANAENAEQLMYISAGLSLIVLPEDETADVSKWYTDRAPIHPTTGQRVKGISAAAATAGEVMLDRKRKGALLRKERLDQLHARGGSCAEYSRLQLLAKNPTVPVSIPSSVVATSTMNGVGKATAPSTSLTSGTKCGSVDDTKMGTVKPGASRKGSNKANAGVVGAASAATAKAIRARVQATMSVQTLLSLSPTGEELRTDGKLSAATLALMERGIGTLTSKSHPRYRHPYPESAGGRRRALHGGSSAAAAKESAGLPWSLPPLPTVKERRSRKRLPTPARFGDSARAREAIYKVLVEFDKNCRGKRRKLSEISFLHGIQDFGRKSSGNPSSTSYSVEINDTLPKMDPTLAFHVMRAVGLIQSADGDTESPIVFPLNLDKSMFPIAEKHAMGDDGGVSRRSISKLRYLHDKFTSSNETFSDRILLSASPQGKPLADDNQVPVAVIRGGGEAMKEISADTDDNNEGRSGNSTGTGSPKPAGGSKNSNGTVNKSSVPGHILNHGQANSPQPNIWNDQSRLVLMNSGQGNQQVTHLGQYPSVDRFYPNAVQLANQLRLSRMPNPGNRVPSDLSEYIGSLHPQAASGYDWSAVNAASAAAAASAQSLAALGVVAPHRASLMNFPLQDRARAMLHDPSATAAAHVAAARHQQQALAYLSGYPNATGPRFQQDMGATMMNQVFVNQPGMQNSRMHDVQMRQQQQHSRSQQRAQQKPRQEAQAKSCTPIDDEVKSDTTPVGSANVNLETSSPSIKRKQAHGDIQPEPTKRIKVASAPEGKVAAKSTPEPTTLAGSSNSVILNANATSLLLTESEPSMTQSNMCSVMSPCSLSAEVHSTIPKGLQFFVPPAPFDVPTDVASKILDAQSHEAANKVNSLGRSEKSSVVAYIVAVGSAVPIPKALVSNLFKEKLNASPLKSTSMNSIPQSSREAAVATILLWLWKSHEDCFQRAFAKSGRIDVEPECKWLLSAAMDKAISSLGQAMDDPTSRTTTPLAIALMAIKSKTSNQKGSQEKDSGNFVTASLDLLVVSAISKGLNSGFILSRQIDASLPNFNELLDYLDEMRKCALYSKSQERSLLAALISRKATMSLSFSHAYVSAMVRAGEALGHGELFEVIQNEEVNVSTMIPYDVFTDEFGAWEDPCRSPTGFTPNLTGDDLMRQAHARAMIQKSLRKLQERHNIKGGTPISGAYIDPPAPGATSDNKPAANSVAGVSRIAPKRRPSFSEKPVQAGTGSAAATSLLLYEPKHSSAPLEWNAECIENIPYGKHDASTVPRSLSVSQFSLKLPARGRSRISGASNLTTVEQAKHPEPDEGQMKQSTREIQWVDVADIFQNVNMPGTPRTSDLPITTRDRTIFAPTIRQLTLDDLGVDSGNESDEDEDFRDEIVLTRHQEVLDNMKEHLSAFFAAREKISQERRGRKSST